MVTPAEEYGLQLLGAYLESVAALQALVEHNASRPDFPTIARAFIDLLAWETKAETATEAPLPPWAIEGDAVLPVALAVTLGCLKHRRTPPLLAGMRQNTAPPWLPPWAVGLRSMLQALVLLSPADPARVDRKGRTFCRRTIARLATLADKDINLRGVADLVEAELLSRDGASEAAARAYESACSRLAQSRFAALHRFALLCAAAHSQREGLPIASMAFAVKMTPSNQASKAGPMATSNAAGDSFSDVYRETSGAGASNRDLRAAIIATQALAAEGSSLRVVGRIIDTLRVLMGASRVVLVIDKQGSLAVEVDTANTPEMLPHRLLAYAMRSNEPVLLADLSLDVFDDPYIATRKRGSVLCVPWQQTAALSGAVLLENTVTAHAFSAERIGIVQFLAVTAATALTHASLQTHMETVIAQRIQSMKEAMEQAQNIRRSNSEMQMAGGFAHEMRNSLAATRFALSSLSPCTPGDPPGSLDDNVALIQQCLAALAAPLSSDSLGRIRHAFETLKESQDATQATYAVISEGVDRGLHVAKAVMGLGRVAADRQDHTSTLLEPLVNACLSRYRDGVPSPSTR